MAAGFAAIVARRPLWRATVTSVVSYAGIGMLLVCCPVLGGGSHGSGNRQTGPFGIMSLGFCYPGSMHRVTQWWSAL